MIHFYVKKTHKSLRGSFTLEVEYALNKGAFLGILGPSGCGKTTLLRCLAGLEKPEEGFIRCGGTFWYQGLDRVWVPPHRRRVGLVFQDYALFPHLTVEQNLLYAQDDRERAGELLELVRLEGHRSHRPGQLSGGQKQRLALARALMRRPELLLLDEPLSALDEELRDSLASELKRIQQAEGVTAVVVSHSRKEIEYLSTEVMNLSEGGLNSRNHLF